MDIGPSQGLGMNIKYISEITFSSPEESKNFLKNILQALPYSFNNELFLIISDQ